MIEVNTHRPLRHPRDRRALGGPARGAARHRFSRAVSRHAVRQLRDRRRWAFAERHRHGPHDARRARARPRGGARRRTDPAHRLVGDQGHRAVLSLQRPGPYRHVPVRFRRVRHQDQGAPAARAVAEDGVRLRDVSEPRRAGRGAGGARADRIADRSVRVRRPLPRTNTPSTRSHRRPRSRRWSSASSRTIPTSVRALAAPGARVASVGPRLPEGPAERHVLRRRGARPGGGRSHGAAHRGAVQAVRRARAAHHDSVRPALRPLSQRRRDHGQPRRRGDVSRSTRSFPRRRPSRR